MTEAAVAAEVHQALDVHLHFAAEIAFDLYSVSRSSRMRLISPSVSSSVFLVGGMFASLADLSRERVAHAVEVRAASKRLACDGGGRRLRYEP